jgi:hypothetical protein
VGEHLPSKHKALSLERQGRDGGGKEEEEELGKSFIYTMKATKIYYSS